MPSMFGKFFKDKRGNVVITQSLNVSISTWAILTIINFFAHSPQLAWLATAFLFTWAFMELFQGVSPFRRLLGLVVLAGIIVMHLR